MPHVEACSFLKSINNQTGEGPYNFPSIYKPLREKDYNIIKNHVDCGIDPWHVSEELSKKINYNFSPIHVALKNCDERAYNILTGSKYYSHESATIEALNLALNCKWDNAIDSFYKKSAFKDVNWHYKSKANKVLAKYKAYKGEWAEVQRLIEDKNVKVDYATLDYALKALKTKDTRSLDAIGKNCKMPSQKIYDYAEKKGYADALDYIKSQEFAEGRCSFEKYEELNQTTHFTGTFFGLTIPILFANCVTNPWFFIVPFIGAGAGNLYSRYDHHSTLKQKHAELLEVQPELETITDSNSDHPIDL